jgi:hypothetical protein
MRCPVCEISELRILDLPRDSGVVLSRCDKCTVLVQQLPNGQPLLLGDFLERVAAGDDRARAAISSPTATTVHGFLQVLEAFDRIFFFERTALQGSLRTLLAQLENRLDIALTRFAKLEFIDDDAVQGMKSLREARELVSTIPAKHRGVRGREGDA